MIHYIDQTDIANKRVLLRVDFNVSLSPDRTIEDDVRIRQAMPTIHHLLENNNKLIITSHLGRPKERDTKYSLNVVAEKLREFVPDHEIILVPDFVNDRSAIDAQTENQIILLENIRFYPEEKKNNPEFAKQLASLADIYVNDGFGVSHRASASVVGIAQLLPSYAGFLMKKEITALEQSIKDPHHPFVAILGGAKISTKIHLIQTLIEKANHLILGGGLANTFFFAQGYSIGRSIGEKDVAEQARKMIFQAVQKETRIIFPKDVVVNTHMEADGEAPVVKKMDEVQENEYILDIGPESQAEIGSIVAQARTIVWNGPVGYFEDSRYKRGTDFLYYTIAQNTEAMTILGGGDTLAAISKKEHLDHINHISTGGGAMLEFIEKGTLPGIEALDRSN